MMKVATCSGSTSVCACEAGALAAAGGCSAACLHQGTAHNAVTCAVCTMRCLTISPSDCSLFGCMMAFPLCEPMSYQTRRYLKFLCRRRSGRLEALPYTLGAALLGNEFLVIRVRRKFALICAHYAERARPAAMRRTVTPTIAPTS